jgi:Tol biopolymer transport system component
LKYSTLVPIPGDIGPIDELIMDSGWNHLYLLSADGGDPKQITAGNFEDEDPAFSPDGRFIVFVSNRRLLEANELSAT